LTPERWHQISRIFKSAISLDGEARDAFVKGQCGVDESLRSEVEKLLESHQKASDEKFIDGVAVEANAGLLLDEDDLSEQPSRRLNKGQQLGSYVILDSLGAGGMGEVYLAKDSRLDRTVALKVLSQDVSSDTRRMQRFGQEAKIASSLNQPNILTIFEFGEIEGLTFLATEFIDGETLRDYMRGKKLKLGQILDIAIQVLAALDAAHEARIVHRDIKPENVMVRRRDRVVKVLDFGLAKGTERKPSMLTEQESEAATAFKTAPHSIMGTVNYMSPEQAQAHAIDERTDIWSTGVMVYEMVAGMMPFKGATTSHTIVQILEKDPVPLTNFTQRKVPAELHRIVSKALSKSPDERYQTAKDMLIDLRTLKKRLDLDAEIDRTSSPETPRVTVETDEVDRGPQKKRVLAIALIAMALVTAAIFGISIWRSSRATTSHSAVVAPPVPAEERTLTYWITVQKFREGKAYQKPFDLASEINFEADYQIRLNVRSPQSGYLYILNEGPPEGSAQPEFVVLFPSSTANKGSPLVTADQVFQIPEQSWIVFDKQQGTEKLWLIHSNEAVSELEAVREFATTRTAGLVTDPVKNKAVQNFLTTNSVSKPTSEKGDKQTTLKSAGKLLVYAVNLEHH
jgi:serine/threonine protein kinase